jgi:hypothetical protein
MQYVMLFPFHNNSSPLHIRWTHSICTHFQHNFHVIKFLVAILLYLIIIFIFSILCECSIVGCWAGKWILKWIIILFSNLFEWIFWNAEILRMWERESWEEQKYKIILKFILKWYFNMWICVLVLRLIIMP